MRKEIEIEGASVWDAVKEIAGCILLFALIGATVWLCCAMTPAQSSAEADAERVAGLAAAE